MINVLLPSLLSMMLFQNVLCNEAREGRDGSNLRLVRFRGLLLLCGEMQQRGPCVMKSTAAVVITTAALNVVSFFNRVISIRVVQIRLELPKSNDIGNADHFI
jgi:hypothetical protein